MGYESHIDKSLKNRKLYSETNKGGWRLTFFEIPEKELNDEERKWEKYLANQGYQLYNKTIGGQDKGKVALGEYKEPKGYRKGVEFGRKKALAEVKVYFDKYLTFSIKGNPNKIKERKFTEFCDLIKGDDTSD